MKRILLALALLFPHQVFADTVIAHNSKRVCVTPAITAGAYSAGQTVGGGLTFSGLIRGNMSGTLLNSITVIDYADQQVDMEFYITTDTIVSGTKSNGSTFDPSDADTKNVDVVVKLTAADDCVSYADNGACYKEVARAITAATTGADVHLWMVTQGAPTYASTSDITICLTALPD